MEYNKPSFSSSGTQTGSGEGRVSGLAPGLPTRDASSHREGPVAKAIEEQTAKLPSDIFLWAAGGAVITSLILEMTGRKQTGNFIAQWVPTILIAGLYNKIVKTHGHDQMDRGGT